jgi:hypothetical protein
VTGDKRRRSQSPAPVLISNCSRFRIPLRTRSRLRSGVRVRSPGRRHSRIRLRRRSRRKCRSGHLSAATPRSVGPASAHVDEPLRFGPAIEPGGVGSAMRIAIVRLAIVRVAMVGIAIIPAHSRRHNGASRNHIRRHSRAARSHIHDSHHSRHAHSRRRTGVTHSHIRARLGKARGGHSQHGSSPTPLRSGGSGGNAGDRHQGESAGRKRKLHVSFSCSFRELTAAQLPVTVSPGAVMKAAIKATVRISPIVVKSATSPRTAAPTSSPQSRPRRRTAPSRALGECGLQHAHRRSASTQRMTKAPRRRGMRCAAA